MDVFGKEKSITFEEVVAKYEITENTVWMVKTFIAGEMSRCYEDLDYLECKRIFLAEDKNTEQCVRAFANGVKMTLVDGWTFFRRRREDWVKFL